MLEQPDNPMTKESLLAAVRSGRKELEAALAHVPAAEMESVRAEGEWSAKDTLAHIAAWEDRLVALLRACRGEAPMPELISSQDEVDQFNAQTLARSRGQALDDVVAELYRSHSRALAAIESMAEEDLLDPRRFGWTDGEPLWRYVEANLHGHYREHLELIRSLAIQP